MDERYAYRTGRTDPAKSSRGLIAILLICVIFLGGLVSALSILNIHLFRQLQDTKALSFAEGEATQTAEDVLALAGMALQETDPLYQQLHELPQGLFVAQVEPGSQADTLGICPGDVVTEVNEIPISTLEAAKEHIGSKRSFPITLWRDGKEMKLTLR